MGSILVPKTVVQGEVPAPMPRVDASRLRLGSIILATAIGLCFGFTPMFSSALPFFLIPLSQEFGWGRGEISMATVLSMLGVSLASPFAGQLLDRFGAPRVIAVSVLLFSAAVLSMSWLSGSLMALAASCFVVGLAGSGTSMVGYAGVLPLWFEKRLGLALGVAGLGSAVGVGVSPFLTSRMITAIGWRGAFTGLATLALFGGMVAYQLLRGRRGEHRPPESSPLHDRRSALQLGAVGLSFPEAIRESRFWLLLTITFVVPFSILGAALHGAALYTDRGMTAEQAATGAALAGLGAVVARLGVGLLLDHVRAPFVAMLVIISAAVGLFVNSWAVTFPILCVGTFLGGAALGAEGDLLPFMIRRYFGLRAFGRIFGVTYSAYALGGLLGPVAYGYTYDALKTYGPVMLGCTAACAIAGVLVLWMGSYRFGADSQLQIKLREE